MIEKKIFSNNPLDYNQVKCMACHAKVKMHHFEKHLKSHNKTKKQMPVTLHEYQKRYGTKWEYIRKTYHECRICGKAILFDLGTLFKHIKKHHGQTKVRDYINSYIHTPGKSRKQLSTMISQWYCTLLRSLQGNTARCPTFQCAKCSIPQIHQTANYSELAIIEKVILILTFTHICLRKLSKDR